MSSRRRRLPRPRTGRGWLAAGLVTVAVIIGGFVAAYVIAFRGSSPAPLRLSTSTASAGPTLVATQVPGTWNVAAGSVAGYRVREQLAFVGAPGDAVGRTSAVSGTVTLTGTAPGLTVSTAALSVDVSKLTSDDGRRDNRIRSVGLESDRFPTASFVLTTPVALPAAATDGTAFTVSAIGKLTMHGTTSTVTIPIAARLTGSQIELVGSVTFPFQQFGMTAPNILGFVSVQDNATMEFDVKLQRA